jgi:copper chaperone NosL
MKKYFPYITVAFIVVCIILLFLSLGTSQNMTVVYTGNSDKKPIQIELGKFQDSDCGMVIDDITYASQVVSPSGKTYFFHDHGGMVNWLSSKGFKDDAIIWVMAKDTKRYIDGRKAWYSRTDQTPMLYGFGAYEKRTDKLIDFESMFLHMVRGEHLANPKIKQQLLGSN